MDSLTAGAEAFIGLFEAGGETFVGLLTGIIPTLIALLTFIYFITRAIGEERVQEFAKRMTGNRLLRYTVFPLLAVFFLTNPMAYTFGAFLEEKYKPAFYDSAVSFVHPILGLFPHANPAELFVWLGIAEGIRELGLSTGALAVRYFLVGLLVILIRGLVTEQLTFYYMRQRDVDLEAADAEA